MLINGSNIFQDNKYIGRTVINPKDKDWPWHYVNLRHKFRSTNQMSMDVSM